MTGRHRTPVHELRSPTGPPAGPPLREVLGPALAWITVLIAATFLAGQLARWALHALL